MIHRVVTVAVGCSYRTRSSYRGVHRVVTVNVGCSYRIWSSYTGVCRVVAVNVGCSYRIWSSYTVVCRVVPSGNSDCSGLRPYIHCDRSMNPCIVYIKFINED